MKKFIGILVLSLIFATQAYAQTFTAKTNRNEVQAGEVFTLSLVYDGPLTNSEPDLSPLENEFSIFSASSNIASRSGTNTILTNKRWDLSMISDKTEGTIVIPEIKMGNLKSKPITININNNPPANNTQSSHGYQSAENIDTPRYSISVDVDNKEPFVQQQVIYSIIIEDSGSLQISEPVFSENIKDQWIIKSLGNPKVTTESKNGIGYRKIVFDYAIFPQKSGSLELPEVRIDGYYISQSNRNNVAENFFNNVLKNELGDLKDVFEDFFVQKNPVILKTKPSTVEVKSNPVLKNSDWWLPAKNVKISSKWITPASEFKVGEAINRKIEIQAVGVNETQLPNIYFGEIENIKQYPEKPTLFSAVKDGNIVSFSEQSNIYIPTKSGNINIPEIALYWFDTQTGKLEKSTIPATVINVAPNKNYVIEEQNIKTTTVEQNELQPEIFANEEILIQNSNLNVYLLVLTAFILGMVIAYFILRPLKKDNIEPKNFKQDYKKNVITAAKQNDFKALRNNLISWAAEKFNDEKIFNLKDINKHISNVEFNILLDEITANLYSDDTKEWDSDKFINIFEKTSINKTAAKEKNILPKLYKN